MPNTEWLHSAEHSHFPAEKEISGLRFHLHAPFVPELSRASIKETDANQPLFEQLAKLTAASLHAIRDLKLLSGEFLSTLPNPLDSIPPRYQLIRTAVIKEMNNEPLTPTHSKSHAPAKHLLHAKASLKGLLSEEDIAFLVGDDEEPPQWAIGATQKNSNQDRFLAGLAISEWDIEEFVELLSDKTEDNSSSKLDEDFMKWLGSKSIAWHRQMYTLLYKELSFSGNLSRLKPLHLVRLDNGNYSIGSKCYFPTDSVEHDELFPRVDRDIYTSGTSKVQQEYVRKFLDEVGVREVGEVDQIENILRMRYTAKAFKPDIKDIQRFVTLVENDPAQAKIFSGFLIFKRTDDIFKRTDDKWGNQNTVFLDSPFMETGLSAYYDALGEDAKKNVLSDLYQRQAIISKERLRKFAVAVGVQTKLEVKNEPIKNHPLSIKNHPLSKELCIDYSQPNVKRTSTAISEDWVIPHLERLLKIPSEGLSRLIWKTLCEAPSKILKARFRPNQQYQTREVASSLVISLRKFPWVPQQDGEFVRPSDASRVLLPKGFPLDEGHEWLHAVHFGENERHRSEEYKKKQVAARELGFVDEGSLQRATEFAALPQLDQERVLAEYQSRQSTELADHQPRNRDQRAERITVLAANAPERSSENRSRSVSVNREAVKQEAKLYLRHQYTNSVGEMICQACKIPLPFKLYDGSYYVENVEFLSVKNGLDGLKNHHYQNYLALCPTHSAMFQYVNGAPELMKEMFVALAGNELEVVLAQENTTIYFTRTHIFDLKKVIEVDRSEPKVTDRPKSEDRL